MIMDCKICGCSDSKIVYHGIIRDGKFGNCTKDKMSIFQCTNCGAMYHKSVKQSEDEFYQSSEYRESMGEAPDEYEFLHDGEVLDKFNYTGTRIFRDKIVADIGCAGGSFLDYIHGVAKRCVGIEPTQEFRKKLLEKGYDVYAYAKEAFGEYENGIDVIVSFDVIEHVENPLEFMKECYKLCKEGGKIVIGTPTEQPIMRAALGDEYDRFLFSTQHLWVLNKESMELAAKIAGFQKVEVKYKQRYGLGNLISWIKYKKPMGNVKYSYITDSVNQNWIANSEENGLADYIVLYAEK